MSTLEILAVCILPALLTFYAVCRRYTLRLRAKDLGRDWDTAGVFAFSAMMAVIWPLTWLWLVASRPSRAERRMVDQRRVAALIAETERRARELGVGS